MSSIAAKLTLDPATFALTFDGRVAIDPYVDPQTQIPVPELIYTLTLDESIVKQGLARGGVGLQETLRAPLTDGYHSVTFSGRNVVTGATQNYRADIQKFVGYEKGMTITGFDERAGSVAVDYVYGTKGDDTISLGQNDDYAEGGDGNDILDGGTGADTLIGGRGNDTYYVDNKGDVLVENANEGQDTVYSSISWRLGDNFEDLILTGRTAVEGTGNELDNTITGNKANNVLVGLGGNDRLFGGAGNDILAGGDGGDILDGGAGADTMIGGKDNDFYFVDNAKDVVIEYAGGGNDTVTSTVSYSLAKTAEVENLILTGNAAIKGTGNDGANVLTGSETHNILDGGKGDDALFGGKGNDTLYGGQGNDLLVGGDGFDRMYGGAGNDTFQFRAVTDSPAGCNNADLIFDFAKGDKIDLSLIDANETLAGDQAFVLDAGGSFDVGEIRQLHGGGYTRLEINTAGDANPEMILMFKGNYHFAASDFVL